MALSKIPDYYALLCLPQDADTARINTAFRKMALRHHPDKLGPCYSGEATKFCQIKEAHETLSDPESRRKYDLTLLYPRHNFENANFSDKARSARHQTSYETERCRNDVDPSMFGGSFDNHLNSEWCSHRWMDKKRSRQPDNDKAKNYYEQPEQMLRFELGPNARKASKAEKRRLRQMFFTVSEERPRREDWRKEAWSRRPEDKRKSK